MTFIEDNKKVDLGYLNCPHCFKSYIIDMRKKYDKCFVCGLQVKEKKELGE